jgi:hypothetical protein
LAIVMIIHPYPLLCLHFSSCSAGFWKNLEWCPSASTSESPIWVGFRKLYYFAESRF